MFCRSPESQEEGEKGNLVGLSSQHTVLKTIELTVFSSLTQSKGAWTDSYETTLPVSKHQFEMLILFAKTEHTNMYVLTSFHRRHFIHSP